MSQNTTEGVQLHNDRSSKAAYFIFFFFFKPRFASFSVCHLFSSKILARSKSFQNFAQSKVIEKIAYDKLIHQWIVSSKIAYDLSKSILSNDISSYICCVIFGRSIKWYSISVDIFICKLRIELISKDICSRYVDLLRSV